MSQTTAGREKQIRHWRTRCMEAEVEVGRLCADLDVAQGYRELAEARCHVLRAENERLRTALSEALDHLEDDRDAHKVKCPVGRVDAAPTAECTCGWQAELDRLRAVLLQSTPPSPEALEALEEGRRAVREGRYSVLDLDELDDTPTIGGE